MDQLKKIKYISEVYRKEIEKMPDSISDKETSKKYLDDIFSELEEIPNRFGASPNIDSEYVVAEKNPDKYGEVRRKYFFSDGNTAMHINMRANGEFGFYTVLLKYNEKNYNQDIKDFVKNKLDVKDPFTVMENYALSKY